MAHVDMVFSQETIDEIMAIDPLETSDDVACLLNFDIAYASLGYNVYDVYTPDLELHKSKSQALFDHVAGQTCTCPSGVPKGGDVVLLGGAFSGVVALVHDKVNRKCIMWTPEVGNKEVSIDTLLLNVPGSKVCHFEFDE